MDRLAAMRTPGDDVVKYCLFLHVYLLEEVTVVKR